MSRRAEEFRFSPPVFIGSLAMFLLCLSSHAQTNALQPGATTGSSNLDASRVFALGMIETGNDDRGVGRAEMARGELAQGRGHPGAVFVESPFRQVSHAHR
mgnify:CR=1 FL=1